MKDKRRSHRLFQFSYHLPQARIGVGGLVVHAKRISLIFTKRVASLANTNARFKELCPGQSTETLMSFPISSQFPGNRDGQWT